MEKENPYSAAGPHYGHMVQETLMFKYLLDAEDDDIVSLEYYDDIAIENADGNISAIQSKSALSWNPIANRSKDFWKTISNWIVMCQNGFLVPERTKFVIALARERNGDLASMFMKAETVEDFKKIIDAVKQEFKMGIPDGILSYLEIFLKADQDIAMAVVLNFTIEVYDDPRNAILAKLNKRENPRDVDGIFHKMTGWLKNKIESLIINGEPPFVGGKEFRVQLFSTRRELSQIQFLHDFSSDPNSDETGEHLTRTYVKQLDLVDCDTEEKIEAIISYIKSKINKVRWAVDGIVHRDSFKEYYDSIMSKWRNESRKTSVLHKDKTAKERGRIVLYGCNEFKESLSGLHVPSHFARGCFHDCADQLKIGWHEEYLKLLRGESDE